ncbi:MAG: LuxR C-terminal-related transcriptional regulator [Chloroflexales bacterium]|nr:LuxR C-terminal-related transcriptional regulator [Chloroflexales bacterium]
MTQTDTSSESIPLSQREIEILRLVTTGATNQQIAVQLDIAANTVKVHLRNIFAKIGVASRTEASLYAVRAGIIQVATPQAQEEAPPASPPAPPLAERETSTPEQGAAPPREALPATIETAPAAHVSMPPPAATATSTTIEAAPAADPSMPMPTTPIATPTTVRRPPLPWLAGSAVLALALFGILFWLTRTQPPGPDDPITPTMPPSPANQWQSLAIMEMPRAHFGLVENDSRIYAIGGITADGVSGVLERYNPPSDTWTRLTAKPTPVTDIQAVVIGGKIYVAGGELASGAISTKFEAYEPDQDRWTALPDLPAPRSRYAATQIDGTFYLFGGWNGSAYQDNTWMFDPDLGTWQTLTSTPTNPRGNMGLAIVNNRVHLLGGDGQDGPSSLHYVYDPTQDHDGGQPWRVLPRLPRDLALMAAITILNDIYVFDPATGELLTYDTNGETWSVEPNEFPPNSDYLAIVLVDSTRLHLLGQNTTDMINFHMAFNAIYKSQVPLITR